MKIKNIFKKAVKTTGKTQTQKLDKNQLEKVVGGTLPYKNGDNPTTSGKTV
jgi:hypothetical protein